MATVIAQDTEFLTGMAIRSSGLIWKWLTTVPISQVIAHGKIRKPEGQRKTYSWLVEKLRYFDLSLNKGCDTWIRG
jgi:hypothetical protein